MTQGNPFGRAGGRWMTSAKMRALFTAGLTYDEIAVINERSEGWRPSRAAVKRRYEALGYPHRRTDHSDLVPWDVQPQHETSLFRHMLQAESRSRKKMKLSDTDRKLISRLRELLFGRGTLMVVTYDPNSRSGFGLALREDDDEDIVRPDNTRSVKEEIRKALLADRGVHAVSDEELAQLAFRGGVRPEALENAERHLAADLLRKLMTGETEREAEDTPARRAAQ